MKRNLNSFTKKNYDVIIVGGGIFGVCATWEAASRGLHVALLEKGDFSQATSANHLKMIHGGIRYLQHGDIYRIRESCLERSALLRVAPHLCYPIPIVIPTYGHGVRSKEFLRAGLFLYDIFTIDRNSGIQDPDRQILNGSFFSREKVLELFPEIENNGLTGGVVFYDGQIYNPSRLAISFLRSAVDEGADVSNYIEVTKFLIKGDQIFGVEVVDTLTGERFDILGKMVLNASGPWAHRLLETASGCKIEPTPLFSRDLGFVISRRFPHEYGLACQMETKDADAILSRGGRHVFAVPWRNYNLIGCWHVVYDRSPDEISVTEDELQKFIDDINQSYKNFSLTINDILMVNTGLTLFSDNDLRSNNISFGKRSLLIDHEKTHNLKGLVTLIGIRATVARGMAEKSIDLIFKKLKRKSPISKTAVTPIFGGEIECFSKFLHSAIEEKSFHLSADVINGLIYNYGSKYKNVLKYVDENMKWAHPIGDSTVIKAEVIHSIREEMAMKLVDVVFRRTDFGTAGNFKEESIYIIAQLMESELEWNKNRAENEINEVANIIKNKNVLKSYKTGY